MPPLSRSAKLYQERFEPQYQTTRRSPGPRLGMGLNRVHHLPLLPPAPVPSVLLMEDDNPPDAAGTTPWPYGVGEESIT